jgi:hypothetical protein
MLTNSIDSGDIRGVPHTSAQEITSNTDDRPALPGSSTVEIVEHRKSIEPAQANYK